MRYAVVSDIHANMQAWNAVLADLRSQGEMRVICLGDVVGYGPDPRAALESAQATTDCFVLGNHDALFCGMLDESLFSDTARAVMDWTRGQLPDDARRFFGSLPLCLQGRGFRCAHGEFSRPSCFNYVFDPKDAMPSWQTVDDRLLFVGHSHRPGLFILGSNGIPEADEPERTVLEPGKRYLINVGAVGQPRGSKAVASYCIYDEDLKIVIWRRVRFDADAYRRAVERAGIPVLGSYFLRKDTLIGSMPIRKMLNFTPPAKESMGVKGAVAVRDMESAHGRQDCR